ncbi:MFS transporter [Robiginitalea sp. M366]|uniref:MFS transporter n=1 Tax=Robiginitalea aestuariiviva TaxID=3036903 RepID=UPI00240E3873|nr:MFS transporter [Robiginitalea aestuariiviva]MDG1571324.1 MFS transporter [Robiginitalea aestuariiviva]
MKDINKNRLFLASCVALIVTAMTFALRAGIMEELIVDFGFNDTQLGWMNSMAFYGFPVAMIIGGLIYPKVGPKPILWVAFVCHLLGLVLTIVAKSFVPLLVSTFFVGLANGAVEAACNPLIADMYTTNRTTMLNKFHVWFPGGIVIGALLGQLMGSLSWSWQLQIAIMIIPTLIYGYLILGQKFPKAENIESDLSMNIKSMFTPLFLFMLICMGLTATTELGTGQFIERLLGAAGAPPLIILAIVTGLMAVGRYFAGPIIHKLNPIGVLLISSVVATLALFLLSQATGGMVYVAAILFSLGVMYFWPTMVGFISEYRHKTGALGMSIIGGFGMLITGVSLPLIGNTLDAERTAALESGVDEQAADLVAGQATLGNIMWLPVILIVLFGILFAMRNKLEEKRIKHD